MPQRINEAVRGWLGGVVVWLLLAWPGMAAARPNFVFVLVDDMDYAALQSMPLTRKLIGEAGTTFTRNYVEAPLCAPSRSTFLTGLYAHNHRVLTVDAANGGFAQFRGRGHEQRTVAVWLRNAGYRTALIGKYLNGFAGTFAESHVPPGWTYWAAPVDWGVKPYQQYNYRLNENGRVVAYGSSPGDYGTDVYTRKSVEFIRSSIDDDKPFFLFLSVVAPHTPMTVAPRHTGLFAGAGVPRTPNFGEADVSGKPGFLRYPSLGTVTVRSLDTEYAQRLRSLQAVDEAVRTIYTTIKNAGRLDDTYLIFTSDNGYHLGQHRLPAGKQLAYEEDIRLPLLIRGPGIAAGRVDSRHLVNNTDLAPTLAALAGVAVPTAVDGRSLKPLLSGTAPATWRQALPLARWRIPSAASDPWPEFRGTRTDRYTWVEWADGSRELYDNRTDPYQLANLAYDPGTTALRGRLAGLTASLATCRAAACRSAEDRAGP